MPILSDLVRIFVSIIKLKHTFLYEIISVKFAHNIWLRLGFLYVFN